MKEPELTFPPSVAEFVAREYEAAEVILEYGSGGSTILAARLGKKVFSVESDPKWAKNVQEFLASKNLDSRVKVQHADVGETVEWGKPKSSSMLYLRKYLGYSSSIWNDPDFQHPDVILIDGRFRLGCFLSCLSRVEKKTRILFDDYWDREWYQNIEEFVAPVDRVERMAVFEIDKTKLSWSSKLRRLRYSYAVV